MRQGSRLSALPEELQLQIFVKLSYLDNARLRAGCSSFRDVVGGRHFRSALEKCGHFQECLDPLKFFWRNGGLEWIGYDDTLQRWKRLPSLRTLVPPQSRTGSETGPAFLVSTSGGLLCAEISKTCNVECIIVCNPLTQQKKVLPPLNIRGKPEFLRIVYDTRTKSYHVIVVGTQNLGEWNAMKPEIYDSRTEQWEVKEYIPQPSFDWGPLVFESGAVVNDIFFCLAIDDNGYKVLAYNVRRGEWLNPWSCSFPEEPCDTPPRLFSIICGAQLVEYKNRIVLIWKLGTYPDTTLLCFAALKHFRSGDDPEPVWSEDGTICYTVDGSGRATGECNLWHDIRSPCNAADANQCYVVGMGTVTGRAARKGSVESSTVQTQLSPAPPVLRPGDQVYNTLNPPSFSFEPSFIAAI